MDIPVREVGVAGVAATIAMLAVTFVAVGVIWLMIFDPVSMALLANADDVWSLLARVAARLLAII